MKVRSTVFWGERTECKDDLAEIRLGGGQVRNSEAAKEAFMTYDLEPPPQVGPRFARIPGRSSETPPFRAALCQDSWLTAWNPPSPGRALPGFLADRHLNPPPAVPQPGRLNAMCVPHRRPLSAPSERRPGELLHQVHLVALLAMYLLPPSRATPFQLHFNYFRHTPKKLGPKLP